MANNKNVIKDVALPGIVYAIYNQFSQEYDFRFAPGEEPSTYLIGEGWIPVAPYTIYLTLEKPMDLTKATVDAFNAKIQKLKADAQVAINEVEQDLQQFLAIENKEE